MKPKHLALAVAAVALVATPVVAHHSYAMFAAEKMYVWEGTIVKYDWRNPHGHIYIRVAPGAKDPATVGTWDIEAAATNIMARQGWTRATYKPGDKAVIVGQPHKDGLKAGALYYALKDGKRYYVDVNRSGGPGAQGRGEPAGFRLP